MSGQEIKYAGFNRRGWAATIDSIVAYFTTDKIASYLLSISSPQKTSELPDISIEQVLNLQNDPAAAAAMLTQLSSSMNESSTSNFLAGYALEYSIQIAVFLLATAICWKLWAATPGKMLCRIKIVDAENGGNLSDSQIFVRLFGYIISAFAFFLGYIWIGFDKRKQGWHDKMASTVVVFNTNSTK